MFIEGKIKSFNAERGFGFIALEGGQPDLFFHIKDFPNKSLPPKAGEKLQFLIIEDQGKFKADHIVRLDLKAEQRHEGAGRPARESNRASQHHQAGSRKVKYIALIGLMIIAAAAAAAYGKYQGYQAQKQLKAQQLMLEQQRIVEDQRKAQGKLQDQVLTEQGRKNLESRPEQIQSSPQPSKASAGQEISRPAADSNPASARFKCDGRTHCSQMGSYEEAVFFIRNCPNTQMDGNHDGVPCERQFGK
ncbi:cold shock domain-containing protein [Acinetobacter sp.]|uniref:cold shock domain-containing protein n=1 Tax=Acinetobacter sp. TaxID=472 RepID=UPI002FC6A839